MYVNSNGRVFEVTDSAIHSYLKEYGLDEFDGGCLTHLENELNVALGSDFETVFSSRTFTSPSLIFKIIGSRIFSIKISLKYGFSRDAV